MTLLRSIFIVVLVSATLFGQTRSPLNESEPYKLTPGKTFSASGGTTVAATKRISNDIAEAERIIAQAYVGTAGTTSAELAKSAATGALRTLDPHSSFFDRDAWKELLDDEESGYTGIGATIAEFTRDGVTSTYILDTFANSPAAKASLKFGDRIVSINGKAMTGESIDTVRESLRGANGTVLKVTVERSATLALETIDVRRAMVRQPSLPDFYMIRPGVGYIDLTEGFNYTTSDEMDTALRGLKRQGMSSLVVDLRGNPGGIVEQAVKVAEKFLPAGTVIVTQRGRSATDNRDWYSANKTPETMPLVLLVDRDTASASEIVAGALQDNDRAFIIGERTFGKGLVQSVIDLPNGAGLTLTAARYLTPSGRSIQRDYSEIGIYDYYNHTGTTAAIDRPFFEAHTTTGRKVFGGDGIAPDLAFTRATITRKEAELLDPIFFYVRETANHRNAVMPTVTGEANNKYLLDQVAYYRSLAASSVTFAKRGETGQDKLVATAITSLPDAKALAAAASKRLQPIANASPFGR